MYDPAQIIVTPVITEKSTGLRAQDVYVFKVLKGANKDQIKEAVEKMFNVEVKAVNTSKVRSKTRTLGRTIGRTPGWKKAYVKIKEGQKISVMEEIK